MKLIVLATLLTLFQTCYSANILALMPFPSKSHGILQERLLRELSAKNHSVTYLTASVPLKPMNKVKIIEVPNFLKVLLEMRGQSNMNEMRDMTAWNYLTFLPNMGVAISDKILSSEPVQQIINSNEKFDLIIADNFLEESVMAGFAYKHKAPLIAVHSFLANTWANYMVGNPAPAAFIPDPFLAYDTRMNFFERVENFVFGIAFELYHVYCYLNQQDTIMKKYFGADSPPIQEILKNTSLVLVNHHYTLAYPRPYVPNMIEVGGMHIDEPKPLPADLQKYMDDSKNGVILFSLGSTLKSSDLPPEKLQTILKALSKVKQNILWKFEAEITDLPKNVRVMKWIPQSDVLAHPNLKLFITHGGLLSTTESIHRGVPVVGIPFFGDQPLNMRQIENAGFGKTLFYDDITENSLHRSINEVIDNPRYKQKAAEKSKLFKDSIKTPLESAIWWIEYVLRHNGAKHLRSAAQDLNWFQLYLLDVYALSLAVIFTLSAISICTLKLILRTKCGRKTNVSKKQEDKKKN